MSPPPPHKLTNLGRILPNFDENDVTKLNISGGSGGSGQKILQKQKVA